MGENLRILWDFHADSIIFVGQMWDGSGNARSPVGKGLREKTLGGGGVSRWKRQLYSPPASDIATQ